jgi:hypothetical protein
MPGKRVQFDDETWNALDLLARDRMQDFQELADEAFRDLLEKHGRRRSAVGFEKRPPAPSVLRTAGAADRSARKAAGSRKTALFTLTSDERSQAAFRSDATPFFKSSRNAIGCLVFSEQHKGVTT